MTNPIVSIIIVNWNAENYLKNCLSSLKKIKSPSFEIILVDNNSIDNSVNVTKQIFPKAQIIKNSENNGFALANNQGAKLARGEFLLFLNNDTEVTPNFLQGLVDEMKNTAVGVVQPKILLLDEKDRIDSVGSFLTITGFLYHYGFHKKDQEKYDKQIPIFTPRGACMLMRKTLFDIIGGFDNDYFAYFEETDLCWRVWLTGKKILYVPQYFIYHKRGGTSSKMRYGFLQYHSFKNRISTLIKNLSIANLLYIFPAHIIFCIIAIFAYAVKGNSQGAIAVIKAFGWNMAHVKKTLEKRKRSQSQRKLSDNDIWPLIYRSVPIKYYLSLFTGLENYEEAT